MALPRIQRDWRSAIVVTAIVGAAALFAGTAHSQTAVATNPPPAPATSSSISGGDCAAFGKYILDEDKTSKLSDTFFDSVGRFVTAKCQPSDKDGAIQIVTMTDQDAISLRTALRRMGKVDVLGLSGVAHCDRPENGACPAGSASAARPGVGG
jgi:hypothetical protein